MTSQSSRASSRFFSFAASVIAATGLFLFCLDPMAAWNNLVFYVFQSRDIARALDFLKLQPVWFGPEMTGGGNLPGPFYYLLLSLGLAFDPTWHGAWVLMIALICAAALVGFYFLTILKSKRAAILWLMALGFAPLTRHFLVIFINPSYLFLFSTSIFCAIGLAFSSTSIKTRDAAFVTGAFLAGLAAQIHFSVSFAFLSALSLLLFSRRLKLERPSAKAQILALAALLAPLIPYVVWSFTPHSRGPTRPNSGSALDVLPTLSYLFRDLATKSWPTFAKVATSQTLKALPWILAPFFLTFLIDELFLKSSLRRELAQEEKKLKLFKIFSVCAAFGFIPFSYVYFVPIANRYGMHFYLPVLFLSVIALDTLLADAKRAWIFTGLTVLSLALTHYMIANPPTPRTLATYLLVSLLVAFCSVALKFAKLSSAIAVALVLVLSWLQCLHYDPGLSSTRKWRMPPHFVWRDLWSEIYDRTGWKLEDARERIFFVNIHIDADPKPTFPKADRSPQRLLSPKPDGLIVALNPPSRKWFRRWFFSMPIANDVKEALLAGELGLGERIEGEDYVILPYYVRPGARLPNHFHDWGLYYETDPELKTLADLKTLSDIKKNDQTSYLFRWNECVNLHPSCTNGISINFQQTKSGLDIGTRIIGASLSQVSPWILPNWTEAWEKPFIEIECSGKTERFLIANVVGYLRENLLYDQTTNYFIGNYSVIAPLENKFVSSCKQATFKIKAGWEKSRVDSLLTTTALPGQSQTVKIEL